MPESVFICISEGEPSKLVCLRFLFSVLSKCKGGTLRAKAGVTCRYASVERRADTSPLLNGDRKAQFVSLKSCVN